MESSAREPLEKTFAYHRPSAAGLEHIARLREIYSVAKRSIEAECPPSRERSVAITELETSCMWATKAIVINDAGSEIEEIVDRGGDDQC